MQYGPHFTYINIFKRAIKKKYIYILHQGKKISRIIISSSMFSLKKKVTILNAIRITYIIMYFNTSTMPDSCLCWIFFLHLIAASASLRCCTLIPVKTSSMELLPHSQSSSQRICPTNLSCYNLGSHCATHRAPQGAQSLMTVKAIHLIVINTESTK